MNFECFQLIKMSIRISLQPFLFFEIDGIDTASWLENNEQWSKYVRTYLIIVLDYFQNKNKNISENVTIS